MSEKANQIVVLFFGAVVIGGVIMLQVRRSRPPAPATAAQQADFEEPAGAAPPPAITITAGEDPAVVSPVPANPAIAELSGINGELPAAEAANVESVFLPQDEWGRNPFLTLDEIAALSADPEPIEINNEPESTPVVEATPAVTEFSIAAIHSSANGFTAILSNDRLLRVGDQIGSETVRDITNRGIVFESITGTRELLFRGPNITQSVPPGGE